MKETRLYSIGDVAEITGTSPRMIREYERLDLIRPRRINGQRRFSLIEVQFIGVILFYLNEIGMSLNGLRVLFQMAPCWELKQCKNESCPSWRNASAKCYEICTKKPDSPCGPDLCPHCPIFLVSRSKELTRLKINLMRFPELKSPFLALQKVPDPSRAR